MKLSPGYGSYLTGFTLALALTLLGFVLVSIASGKYLPGVDLVLALFPAGDNALKNLPRWIIPGGVVALALVQLMVHLRYFLHLDFSSRQRLNVQAILFALLIMSILVCGTLWIMQDLGRQMTPV
ncbi:cytochrome o ubiquinol oxidase subunit IV [Methylomonas methanica]|uniref:Cytochrome bo(3) ubiquinol oxidase subunit 4 n=1 Tax=Methylomonas methanica (strain DSM 25384 / MC09) TaxID=857087 RepID=F9ZX96_METMM|nr:cytochrome C oxidase subunit IV family protein [Methylomonas methanica]AEF99706.1 cytochrome C oxidase subunit IV [Methylomonas methanica MC09]